MVCGGGIVSEIFPPLDLLENLGNVFDNKLERAGKKTRQLRAGNTINFKSLTLFQRMEDDKANLVVSDHRQLKNIQRVYLSEVLFKGKAFS